MAERFSLKLLNGIMTLILVIANKVVSNSADHVHDQTQIMTKPMSSIIIDKDYIDSQIINGNPTNPHQYPFMVLLVYHDNTTNNYYHHCSAALISPKHVLTVANCVANNSSFKLLAVLGAHYTNDSVEIIGISHTFIHPNYNPRLFWKNDIAVLKLKKKAEIFRKVKPIKIINPNGLNIEDLETTVIGWGYTSQNLTSDVLLHAQVYTKTYKYCKQIEKSYPIMSPGQICSYTQTYRPCTFDGVLTYNSTEGEMQLVGLLSWVYTGCPDKPVTYTRVDYFDNWINATLVL